MPNPTLQTVTPPEMKEAINAIAKAKGMSVSDLTRAYITKGMVVDLPLVQRSGGWPTYAELGSDDAIVEYMAMRFGLRDEDTAKDLIDFLDHVLKSREQTVNKEFAAKLVEHGLADASNAAKLSAMVRNNLHLFDETQQSFDPSAVSDLPPPAVSEPACSQSGGRS